MARKQTPLKRQLRKRYKDLTKGIMVQAAKEISTIPAYAMREITGTKPPSQVKCTLKKCWFE